VTAFSLIYDWMITGEPSYIHLNRENVLDIFISAKYLKIKGVCLVNNRPYVLPVKLNFSLLFRPGGAMLGIYR